jgi:hypothetical protein
MDADTDIVYLFLNLLFTVLHGLPRLPTSLICLASLVRLASVNLFASLVSLDFLVILTCVVSLTSRIFLFYFSCLASLVSLGSMVSLTIFTNLLGLHDLPSPPDRPGLPNLIFFSQVSPVLCEHF